MNMINTIDPMFWITFVGVIVQAIAAIGTCAAVFVALYQNKEQKEKRVKVKVNYNSLVGVTSLNSFIEVLTIIDVVNTGMRVVNINQFGIKIGNEMFVIFSPSYLGNFKNPKLPICLYPEEVTNYSVESQYILNNLSDSKSTNADEQIKAFVTDVTGEIFYSEKSLSIKECKELITNALKNKKSI